MKKTLATVIMLATSMSAHADFLLGGDLEVNAWKPSVQLDGTDVDSISTISYIGEASLEHGIPLIPNAKLNGTYLSEGDLTYTKVDAILYYEILDNDLVSLDLGAGLSSVEFEGQRSDFNIGDVSGALPTAYLQAEIGVPTTPLFVYAKGYASGDGDSVVTDLSAGLQYSIGLVALDLELQAGYKMQELDFEDFDGATSKVDMSGAFAGVNIDF